MAEQDEPKGPTVKAVLAEARRLREHAARERAADMDAKPYEPSDKTARNLSAKHGPEGALALLRQKSVEAGMRYREQREYAERRRKRHERQQRLSDAERRHRLSGMTLGQRLDEALAGLAVWTDVGAATNGERISHGKPDSGPAVRHVDDVAGRLRGRALRLVAELEDEVPRAQQRVVNQRFGGDAA
jgi:hypothetical protein